MNADQPSESLMKLKPTDPNKLNYVYVYSDPRTNVPRYVGIGFFRSGRTVRAYTHWNQVRGGKSCYNKHLNAVLRGYIREGIEPKIEIVAWLSSQAEAKAKEIELISLFGRKIDGGTLCNFTAGGDGTQGFSRPHNETDKAKISEASKAAWQDPEYRAKRAQSQREWIESRTPEQLAAWVAKVQAKWTPEKRAAFAEAMAEIQSRPEVNAKRSATLRANPEFMAGAKKRGEALQTEETFAKRSATLKERYADPEKRAALSAFLMAASTTPEALANRSAAMKALWDQPAYVEKMKARPRPDAKKHAGAMKAGIANMDPETKARLSRLRSENMKARHAARKSALLSP